jgi:hypothetical protein
MYESIAQKVKDKDAVLPFGKNTGGKSNQIDP